MSPGNPDLENADPGPSLAQRLAALAKQRPAARPATGRDWLDGSVAALFAALVIAGPLLTIGGAKLLAAQQRAATAKLADAAAPRIESARAASEARAQLGVLLRRPTLSATIETLARALPPDAALVRASRTGQGMLELEIEVSDPDTLRAALRRAPAFQRLRNTGQRQADARMIVTLAGPTP